MITNMKFGECLKRLLSILDISINRLSKAINVDNSLVNRWVNEKRIPPYKNVTYIERISEYLFKNILNSYQERHINELFLSICGDNGMEMNIKDKIKKMLLESQGYSIECKNREKRLSKSNQLNPTSQEEITKFLNRQFSFGKKENIEINSLQLTTYNQTSFMNLSSEDTIIIGNENILSIVISLLEAAASQKYSDNNTIYILFTGNRYNNELAHVKNAMLKAINSGWNIVLLLRLNNDIDRTIRFINFVQPLLSTGKFNTYYFKKYDISTIEKDLVIVPGIGALFCLAGTGHSGIDRAFYFKNSVAVDILKDYFNIKRSTQSHPLIKYYIGDNTIEYSNRLVEDEERMGNRFIYKYDFSILTLPENLYRKFLQRKKVSYDKMITALEFYRKRLDAFLSNVNYYKYYDIYSIDSINNIVIHKKFYLYSYMGVEIIDLEVQDIVEILQNIVNLLERYENYNMYFMSPIHSNNMNFANFYCVIKEKQAVLMESCDPFKKTPEVRLCIEEPTIIKAFEEYYREIIEQIPFIYKDKEEVIKWIKSQIVLFKTNYF